MSDIISPTDAVHLLLIKLVLGQLVGLGHARLVGVQDLLVIYLRDVFSMVSVDAQSARQRLVVTVARHGFSVVRVWCRVQGPFATHRDCL